MSIVQATLNVTLAVLLVLQVNATERERDRVNMMTRAYSTCRRHTFIANCKLSGYDSCEEAAKKAEEQAKDFVRGLSGQ